MDFKNENRHMVDVLFVLTLFFVFALSALTLVILGANIYRSTVNHMGENFTNRTSYAYVTQKIRQNDESNTIYVSSIGDADALLMTSEVNNTIYNTYIYEYDGYLCELLTRADIEAAPSDGQRISELKSFAIDKLGDNLYKFNMETKENDSLSVIISSHSKSGGNGQ